MRGSIGSIGSIGSSRSCRGQGRWSYLGSRFCSKSRDHDSGLSFSNVSCNVYEKISHVMLHAGSYNFRLAGLEDGGWRVEGGGREGGGRRGGE
jgi:hypothetical protein